MDLLPAARASRLPLRPGMAAGMWMRMNELLTLDITALSHDGRGVARLADKGTHTASGGKGPVVFVKGALPGQQVSARVIRQKSSFAEAETVALLRPAADAAPPICPHHDQCGGCPLQTMPYAQQLYWKRTLALDALQRIGGLDRTALEALFAAPEPSPALMRYRNKMEFAFGNGANGELVLGLRRRNGRDVVNVPGCVLMPPEAQGMTALARSMAQESGLAAHVPQDAGRDARPSTRTAYNRQRRRQGRTPAASRRAVPEQTHALAARNGFWRFFILRRGLAADLRTPRWWALCVTSAGDSAERAAVRALGRELLAAFPQLAAFIHEERATEDALALGEKRVQTLDSTGAENPGAARLRLPLAGKFFALDAASFFQVNTGAAQTLARTAAAMLAAPCNGPACGLLDLYCGAGAPGLVLADGYAAMLGIEQDARAITLAQANANALSATPCRYVAGDAADLLERFASRPNALWSKLDPASGADTQQSQAITITDALVDPPRAGLSPKAMEALLALLPRRILYISCNPSTLARDAARLKQHYRLERLTAVDLFPHTPHLECLSLWQRIA